VLTKLQLLELAIPGLDRKPLPASLAKPPLPDADALLSAIAHTYLAHKAAKPLLQAPPLPPSPIPANLYPHHIPLQPLLQGPYQQVLPEFLQALIQANTAIPAAILPHLLELASQNHPLKSSILRAAGSTGQWLAAQIPRWNNLFHNPNPAEWPVASLPKRIEILNFLRIHHPDQASQWLSSSWHQDSAHEKLSLLQCLRSKLSPADEAFLEHNLSDKRKAIRNTAATLLAYMPNSVLSTRLQSLAASLISVHNNHQLRIQFPEAYTQDGLDLPQNAKSGAKTTFLFDLCARINPDFWSSTPAHFLQLAQQSPWVSPLLNGISEAIGQFRNARWAKELLLFLGEHEHPDVSTSFASALEAPALEMALNKQLSLHRGILRENTILFRVMSTTEQPWSETMTRTFIQHLRSWSAQPNAAFWQIAHYRSLLSRCAFTCPVQLLDFIEKDWPAQPGYWQHLEKEILSLIQTIAYRKKILEPLSAV
jgi:hypothetical protein